MKSKRIKPVTYNTPFEPHGSIVVDGQLVDDFLVQMAKKNVFFKKYEYDKPKIGDLVLFCYQPLSNRNTAGNSLQEERYIVTSLVTSVEERKTSQPYQSIAGDVKIIYKFTLLNNPSNFYYSFHFLRLVSKTNILLKERETSTT